jgi:hypothetical protein
MDSRVWCQQVVCAHPSKGLVLSQLKCSTGRIVACADNQWFSARRGRQFFGAVAPSAWVPNAAAQARATAFVSSVTFQFFKNGSIRFFHEQGRQNRAAQTPDS